MRKMPWCDIVPVRHYVVAFRSKSPWEIAMLEWILPALVIPVGIYALILLRRPSQDGDADDKPNS